jgi:hypothetical protein
MRHGVVRPLPQLATALLVLPVVVLVTAAGLRRLEHRTLRSLALGFDHRWGKAVALGLALGALTPALVATLLRVGGYAQIAPTDCRGLVEATLPMTLASHCCPPGRDRAPRAPCSCWPAGWAVLAAI